mmetsp:Transcript_13863/g.44398  ORF Transcript_13863/g.44398 Transcript_13863/m.44398 type:complete len:250 (+) Transcript_13863:709-1458(+)
MRASLAISWNTPCKRRSLRGGRSDPQGQLGQLRRPRPPPPPTAQRPPLSPRAHTAAQLALTACQARARRLGRCPDLGHCPVPGLGQGRGLAVTRRAIEPSWSKAPAPHLSPPWTLWSRRWPPRAPTATATATAWSLCGWMWTCSGWRWLLWSTASPPSSTCTPSRCPSTSSPTPALRSACTRTPRCCGRARSTCSPTRATTRARGWWCVACCAHATRCAWAACVWRCRTRARAFRTSSRRICSRPSRSS